MHFIINANLKKFAFIWCTLIYVIVNLNHATLQHLYLKIYLFPANLPVRQVVKLVNVRVVYISNSIPL